MNGYSMILESTSNKSKRQETARKTLDLNRDKSSGVIFTRVLTRFLNCQLVTEFNRIKLKNG